MRAHTGLRQGNDTNMPDNVVRERPGDIEIYIEELFLGGKRQQREVIKKEREEKKE